MAAIPGVIYEPKNVIATYTDKYGEERAIHAPKGRALRVASNSDTPVHRMNRAAAVLLGKSVKARREAAGLTMKELGDRAGLHNANQKSYVWGIENPVRANAIRIGTLYALAAALDCEPGDLLPTAAEVMRAAGISQVATPSLVAA